NRLWVTLSGYTNNQKVYFSNDAGATWSNFSTGLPNIPANCIAYHEGTNDAVYVGTDAGVYYRDNSFTSWQPYKDGLPNCVVTELEIQYGSNTICASTYGRGLWHAPLFTLPATDAGIVSIESPTGTICLPDISPAFTLANFGSDDLTSVSVEYGAVGSTLSTYTWTGTLTTGQTASINLPSFNNGTGTADFIVNILTVNGVAGDDSALNNSATSSYYVTGGVNDVTFTLTTDCWGTETSWTITDANGVEIYSDGSFASQTTLVFDLCLPDGCFTLNVNDSYGDGLSGIASGCSTDGDYVLTDAGGNILAQMTTVNFGFGTQHAFCVGSNIVPGCTDVNACNYNSAATAENGSCIYPGCTDLGACNYNPAAGCDDGSCEFTSCVGCTDPYADNYNPAATIDDGSCIFTCTAMTLTLLFDNYPTETTWDIVDDVTLAMAASGGPYPGMAQSTVAENFCLGEGCYTLTVYDSFGDGMQYGGVIGDYQLTDALGNVYATIVAGGNFGSQAVHNFCISAAGVDGCTNAGACNYNPSATNDDGSCEFLSCAGCTNASACNYDAAATIDDGSCLQFDECGNCGGSATAGCTDPAACNYDVNAGCDDGSCLQLDECGNCGGSAIAGCTNPTACNYNANASCDDGSCLQFDECGNCGGTSIAGCTNPVACNYNANAACENGSCELPAEFFNCDGTPVNDTDGDGVADELEVAGCTDPEALNYNPDATDDNGSCTFGLTGSTHSCGAENVHNPDLVYGSVTDIDGNTYRTIVIGNQEWMAENLTVEHYANGDL
ncbi:MAG: hypothetical protein NWS86_09905, partial [Flavobacteriales bacterium]|nr:hypothetical protein [Flavobacteriales bacterium]